MYIKQITIHNFKSIEDAQIEFTPFTMLVGANAAGKSNIINVFRFIQSIIVDGLDNAIALQGGIQYVAKSWVARLKFNGCTPNAKRVFAQKATA